jgi:four helix bundle protein
MAQFIRLALGSCTELEYQVLLSQELQFMSPILASDLNRVTTQLRAMLASFHRKLDRGQNHREGASDS